MKESQIQAKCHELIKKYGHMYYKITDTRRRGIPDDIVLMGYLNIFFVEYKSPGKKPSGLQLEEIKRIRERGQIVFVIDSPAELDILLDLLKTQFKLCIDLGVYHRVMDLISIKEPFTDSLSANANKENKQLWDQVNRDQRWAINNQRRLAGLKELKSDC